MTTFNYQLVSCTRALHVRIGCHRLYIKTHSLSERITAHQKPAKDINKLQRIPIFAFS